MVLKDPTNMICHLTHLDCFVQELIAFKPYEQETFFAAGQRIQNSVFPKIKSFINSLTQRHFRMDNYDKSALKIFIIGLTRNLNNLELAMQYLLDK